MPDVITKEQIQAFYTDGYLVVKGGYPIDELLKIRGIFDKAFAEELWKKSAFDTNEILSDIYLHFPDILNVIFSEKVINTLKDILGENLICIPECAVHRNRYINWHRDTTRMEKLGEKIHIGKDKMLIQCAVYFQDNNEEGGGLKIVPGSHIRKDRFVKMYSPNLLHRVVYKMAKLVNASPFTAIEENDNPVNILSEIGDMVLFNSQADHRSTFALDRKGKPIISKTEKFAIFNCFTNDMELARRYRDSDKNANEPYANFLKQSTINQSLVNRARELNIRLCH